MKGEEFPGEILGDAKAFGEVARAMSSFGVTAAEAGKAFKGAMNMGNVIYAVDVPIHEDPMDEVVGTWMGKPMTRREYMERVQSGEMDRHSAGPFDFSRRWSDYVGPPPEMRAEVRRRAENPHPDPVIGNMDRALGEADKAIENFDRFYASERVFHEQIGTGDNKTTCFKGKLDWTPVRPWDKNAKVGVEFVTRDFLYEEAIRDESGDGILRGDTAVGDSWVDYKTGNYKIVFSAPPASGEKIFANYWFSMEGVVPEQSPLEKSSLASSSSPDFAQDYVVKGGYFCAFCGSAYREKDVECRKCGAPRTKENTKPLEHVIPHPESARSERPIAASQSIVHKGDEGRSMWWYLGTAFTLVTGTITILTYLETLYVAL